VVRGGAGPPEPPLTLLPLWDLDACVAEIHPTAAKGSQAIAFPENPAPLGLPFFHTDHWHPVFSAAEAGMPLTMCHPRLKVGLSEGGIGWVPYTLERIDSVGAIVELNARRLYNLPA
jgi:hypothetical protein